MTEHKHVINIFTDGSFSSSTPDVCGIGIHFPNGEFDDVSSIYLIHPTNQRAELQAIFEAIQIVRQNEPTKPIYIYTDSKYAIGACTKWLKWWKLTNWQTSKDTPVMNQDILKPLSECLSNVTFHHVRAHTSQTTWTAMGNRRADQLARNAILTHKKDNK